MRNSIFDYIDNLDTLIAVIVGALLATGGAVIAELVQDRLGQKRRERDAARFFGEILFSVDNILDRAFNSMEIGERWGPVTQRLFRTALSETRVYERNRERLFEIRDLALRRTIHVHFLTETVPLVALIDDSEAITRIEKELSQDNALTASQKQALSDELTELQRTRETALRSVKSERERTDEICAKLEPIAKLKF